MEHRTAFRRYLRTGDDTELRAIGETSGSNGGFMLPQEFAHELTVTLKQYGRLFSDMRRIETANGRVMFAPIANFSGSGSIVADNPGSPLTPADRVYAQVTLNGYTVTSGIHQISIPVEEDSAFPVEGLISDFAGEMIGRALATLSVSGSGTSQPTGVYTAVSSTALALTAAQAVFVDGATTTELASGAPSPKTLRAMVAAIDPAYSPSWYMNASTYAALCGVTGNAAGSAPLILPNGPRELHGFPVVIANELSSLTASTVSGPILADLGRAFYWRDAGTEVVRLGEKYADYGAVGYVALWRGDLQPRDTRALVALKAAAT